MPRQTGISVSNNFVGGLITEAPFLGFPPNACTETLDCEHTLVGSVQRRLGWDYEINHSTKSINRTNKAINNYLWKDVSGDGTLSLQVLQVGGTLYFYDASSTDPLSSRPITANVDITAYQTPSSPDVSTQECQFTAGNGFLFVAHPYTEAFSVAYDANTQTFTTTEIKIYIRDFEGLDDGFAVDERPATGYSGLSVEHHYNLLNEGWTNANLQTWDGARTDMPSNVDTMSYFTSPDTDGVNKFDVTKVDQITPFIGNTPSATGHYVLNVFDKNRSSASGLVIPNETTNYQRCSSIAFYSGRVFYSGVNYAGLSSSIFFSQIIENSNQYGECYQRNDPTSDKLFDLLPTDGGVIVIQEAGTILKLLSVPGALLVFASNGIWSVTGSTGLGFTASDYSVAKLSSVPALTSTSFIDVNGVPVWWNLESIYKLEATQAGFQVTSLTNQSIKTFYRSIPPSEKRNARGSYNPVTNIIQWLYSDTESSDIDEYYNFNRVLNFNVLSNSFYIWTIPATIYQIHGITVLENRGGSVAIEDVVDNTSTTVTANDTTDVQIWAISNGIVVPNFKYVISISDTAFSFAETRQSTYTDWHEGALDTNYSSTFTTGYAAQGKGLLKFQNNYINFYSGNDSKYYVRGVFDFGNSGDSGAWSTTQIVDSGNFDVVYKRLKIRGTGEVLQIQIKSFDGENFDIKGWSAFVTSNASV